MKKYGKVILWIVAGFAVAVFSVLAFVGYVFSDWGLCENTIHQEVNSPSKLHRVIVFERNCGATTGFSTQVSVLDANEQLQNSVGNTYIVDGQPEFVNLEIRWLTEDHLLVGNANKKAFKASTQVNSVMITFE